MSTEIIDLTHPLNNNIAVYPGTSSPEFKQINFIEKDILANGRKVLLRIIKKYGMMILKIQTIISIL